MPDFAILTSRDGLPEAEPTASTFLTTSIPSTTSPASQSDISKLSRPRYIARRTEDDVVAVEPVGDDGGDEELRAVGVLSGVSHRKETRAVVLPDKVLVLKLLAVDGLATSAVVAGEVTTLEHELDAVAEWVNGTRAAREASGKRT